MDFANNNQVEETTEKLKFFIETYGCQMNVADSELVVSVMEKDGFEYTDDSNQADIVFINTCSVRDNAEQRIRGRLGFFKVFKRNKPSLLVGVIGCMAERLKEKLLEQEQIVDLVVGPDAYRTLPALVKSAGTGQRAVNVLLSREETYADISPVRMDKNKVSAFVSIMRGCDNVCSFCIVPFTRGRERSRPVESILREVQELVDNGYKEVTLLGQNVDKYNWNNGETNFASLLEKVAQVASHLRVRFSTSFPQDMTDEELHVMAKYSNICRSIHLPVQAGSTKVLEAMKRGYTREWYMDRISAIRSIVPDCAISTDIIAGFCTETEEDHKQTLELMEWAKFDFAYMFKYSERPNTFAARNLKDDVDEDVKTRRLSEINELQNKLSLDSNHRDLGQIYEVLVEDFSKKSEDRYCGRTSQNKMVVFPKENCKIGDYVNVQISSVTSATLLGFINKDHHVTE